MEKVKPIKFEYEGKEYTLEFTRDTVRTIEKSGFDYRNIDSKQMDSICTLFAGAFLAHHRFVKPDVIDKIYAKMPNKSALLERLAMLYMLPYEELVEEVDEKNAVKWE